MRFHLFVRLLVFAALLGVAGVCGGCGGGSGSSVSIAPNGNVVQTFSNDFTLQPNVNVLPTDGSVHIIKITNKTVVLSGPSLNLAVGQVIILNQGPQQFLRKIIAVSGTKPNFTLETGPAAITEVFSSVAIAQHEVLGASFYEQFQHITPTMPGVSFGAPITQTVHVRDPKGRTTNTLITQNKVPINFNNAVVQNFSGGSGQASVTVNGQLLLSVELATDLHFLPEFHALAEPIVEVTGDLTVNGDVSADFHHSQNLLPIDIPLAGIGFGPVSLSGGFNLALAVDGHVDASGKVGLHAEITKGVGFEVLHGQLVQPTNVDFSTGQPLTTADGSLIDATTFQFTQPPSAQVSASISVTMAAPQIGITLLGFGYVNLQAAVARVQLDFTAQTDPPGFNITPSFNLDLTIHAGLDFHVPFLPNFDQTLAQLPLGSGPLALPDGFPSFIPLIPPIPTVTSVDLTPVFPAQLGSDSTVHMNLSSPAFLSSTMNLSDGTSLPGIVTWASDNPSVVDVSGLDPQLNVGPVCTLVANQAGTANITATSVADNSIAAVIAVTVDQPLLVSISVGVADSSAWPDFPNVQSFAFQQLQATGTYDDGSTQDLTNTVSWSPGVSANSNVTVNDGGQVSGNFPGTVTVTATDPDSGTSGSTDITVTAPSIVSVTLFAVDPNSGNLLTSEQAATVGSQVQYKAFGVVQDGSLRDITNDVTFQLRDDTVATLTVDTTNSVAVVQCNQVGEDAVQAFDPVGSGGQAVALLHVSNSPLTGLQLTSPASSVLAGNNVQLTVTAVYQDGTSRNVTGSADLLSLNLANSSVDHDGTFHAFSAGPTVVVASYGNQLATVTIQVAGPTDAIFTQNYPTSLTTAQTFGAQVSAEDLNGNVVDISDRNITLQVNGSPGLLAGPVSAPLVHGVATFSNLSIPTAGTYSIRAFGGGIGISSGPDVVVTKGSGGGGSSAKFAWVADGGNQAVVPLTFNGTTMVANGSPVGVGVPIRDIKALADGTFLFASNSSSPGSIMRFSINPDGTLVRQAPDVSVNGQAYNIVIAPNQNRLYVSEPDTCQIYGFSIASGNLTAISGTPWSTAGVRPLQMTIDPSGSFLYVVNQSTNNVSGFIISSSDGSLSPLLNSPYALSGSGPSPVGIVFDPQGSFVYVGESNGHVAMMSISGGIPTEVSGSPFSSGDVGTQWLTVTPDGNCVIAANTGSTTLSTFTINRSTPALNMVSGSPFGTGANNPEIMAMDPSGAFVYAPCNGLSGTPGLSVMTINADHSLTGLSGNPFSAGTLPLAVTVH